MKGISPVVATVLLLLIVVAIIGYSFGFFQRFFATAGSAGEEQLGSAVGQIQQAARIENAAGTSLTIRNSGTNILDTDNVAVYVNNVAVGCTWSPSTVPPAGIATCTLASSCSTGATIRITTPGLSDSRTC